LFSGNTERLEEHKVIVGGDQLTRKRLHDCKKLRILSPDPVMKLSHLDPVVIELWHMKQDLLAVGHRNLCN